MAQRAYKLRKANVVTPLSDCPSETLTPNIFSYAAPPFTQTSVAEAKRAIKDYARTEDE